MELCRLCFSETSLQLCINLFDDRENEPSILDIIAKLTDIKMYESDPFSKVTCFDCYGKLINFYDFRLIVVETDMKFRQKFNSCKMDSVRATDLVQDNIQIKLEKDCDDGCVTNVERTVDSGGVADCDVWEEEINKQFESNKNIDECPLVDSQKNDEIGQQVQIKQEFERIEIEDNFNGNVNDNLAIPNHGCHGNDDLPKDSNIITIKIEHNDNEITMDDSVAKTIEECIRNNMSPNGEDSEGDFKREFKNFGHNADAPKKIVKKKRHKQQLKCDTCGKTFKTELEFKIHRIQDSKKPFRCKTCCKGFYYEYVLNNHLKEHSYVNPNKCEICNKSLLSRRSLMNHRLIHTGEQPFKCGICNKGFRKKYSLNNHLRTHTGEKPFECEFCNKKFSGREKFKNHLKNHGDIAKLFKCYICDEKFIEACSLDHHLRIHPDIGKPYQCVTCHKRFVYQSCLNEHLRLHTGENIYECNVCNRRFLHESHFKSHLPVHANETNKFNVFK